VAGARASKDPKISKDTRYIIEGLLLLSVVKAQAGAHITDYDNDEYISKLQVSPKTVDEAIDRMISDLDLRAKVLIANMDFHQLFDQHSSLFIYFKNSFEVWPGNKELIESCRAIAKGPVRDEDDATVVLLGVLWKRLQDGHKLKAVK